MIEVNASFQSVKASVTSLQAQYSKDTLAYQKAGNNSTLGFLNNQENQVVDDVDISQQALQALEDAKSLNNFLQKYLDYLRGDNSVTSVTLNAPSDSNTGTQIAARSTELSASITKISYEEENLELTARFTDDGNLQELTISKSSIKAEYVQAQLIIEDRQFYASY